jgi:polyphosphate kinase 2 (PPK2 family)
VRAGSAVVKNAEHAPWTLVDAEDERHARLEFSKAINLGIERAESAATA